jgi:hypothetical protein
VSACSCYRQFEGSECFPSSSSGPNGSRLDGLTGKCLATFWKRMSSSSESCSLSWTEVEYTILHHNVRKPHTTCGFINTAVRNLDLKKGCCYTIFMFLYLSCCISQNSVSRANYEAVCEISSISCRSFPFIPTTPFSSLFSRTWRRLHFTETRLYKKG